MFLSKIKTCIFIAIIITIINIVVFVYMIEYGNEVFNMIAVTLSSFFGKMSGTIGPLLEELEGKKYKKILKKH